MLVPREAESEAESRRSEVGRDGGPQDPGAGNRRLAEGSEALHRYWMVVQHSIFDVFCNVCVCVHTNIHTRAHTYMCVCV